MLARLHHGLRDRRVLAQAGGDLRQIDPEAANLDLRIPAPQHGKQRAALRITVWQPARPVSGAEQAAGSEGIGDEAFGCHLRLPVIAAREAQAADIKFALRPRRHRLQPLVEDIAPCIVDGPSDGHCGGQAARLRHESPRIITGDIRRNLGGAIEIDQPRLRARGLKAAHKRGGQRLAAANPLRQQGQARAKLRLRIQQRPQ